MLIKCVFVSFLDFATRDKQAELPVLRLETALSSVPLEERETRASSFGRRRTARFGFDSRLKSRLFRSGLLFWHVIGDVVPFCCTLRCWEQPQF